jgi:RimJ/RimL family protein N-acetyltransferase
VPARPVIVSRLRIVLEQPLSDGLVAIRCPMADDGAVLVAGRDAEFFTFLGEGSAEPEPTACIVVNANVVGWVDFDHDRSWLQDDEVNLGYNVFEPYRGRGYATRAVLLLMEHLREHSDWRIATLLIDPDNARSLAVARRAGFVQVGDLDGNPYWKKQIRMSSTDEV